MVMKFYWNSTAWEPQWMEYGDLVPTPPRGGLWACSQTSLSWLHGEDWQQQGFRSATSKLSTGHQLIRECYVASK